MLFDLLMPWWAWLYLGFTLSMFILSLFVEKPANIDEMIGSALSLFTICISVIGFFNHAVVELFGLLLIPMIVIGCVWEFKRAIEETERTQEELKKERELSEGEQGVMLYIAIGFNATIVVPGYTAGMVVCYHMVGGMLGA